MNACEVCNGSGTVLNQVIDDAEPDFESTCPACHGSGEGASS